MTRRYPAYRESGVEWLGEVPVEWEVRPVKAAFQIVGGTTPKSDVPEYWDGEINWITPADLSNLPSRFIYESGRQITEAGLASCGTNLVPPNSIVLSVRAPIGSLAIAGTEICTNQGCKALVPQEQAHTDFYYFVIEAARAALNVLGRGSTFLELSGDQLASFRVPLPPLSEQTAIAAFLDRETAKIDALVAEQRRLVDLLKEKRQAVISHAVTRGLNPAAKLKPSGVDWLGDVPEGWTCGKLGHFAWLQGGFAFPSEAFGSEGVAVVKMTNLDRGVLAFENAAYIPEDAALERVALKEGDLVWGMSGSVGETGSLGNFARVRREDLPCQLNQRVGRFLPLADALSLDFLEFIIQSRNFYEQVLLWVTGTAQFNISSEQAQSCKIAVPPRAEQEEIVAFLKQTLGTFDTLTQTAESAIALLQERRAALISAAVTGKIDVRDLVPQETEAA